MGWPWVLGLDGGLDGRGVVETERRVSFGKESLAWEERWEMGEGRDSGIGREIRDRARDLGVGRSSHIAPDTC